MQARVTVENDWKELPLTKKNKNNILKGKRNAYFLFLDVGFIFRTLFFLISAIYTH